MLYPILVPLTRPVQHSPAQHHGELLTQTDGRDGGTGMMGVSRHFFRGLHRRSRLNGLSTPTVCPSSPPPSPIEEFFNEEFFFEELLLFNFESGLVWVVDEIAPLVQFVNNMVKVTIIQRKLLLAVGYFKVSTTSGANINNKKSIFPCERSQ